MKIPAPFRNKPAPPNAQSRRKNPPSRQGQAPRNQRGLQNGSSPDAPQPDSPHLGVAGRTILLGRLWRPRGLFFKIFGWFLAAQLLIAVTLYALATATQRSLDQNYSEQVGANLELRARAAAIAYENGGAAALGEAWQSALSGPGSGPGKPPESGEPGRNDGPPHGNAAIGDESRGDAARDNGRPDSAPAGNLGFADNGPPRGGFGGGRGGFRGNRRPNDIESASLYVLRAVPGHPALLSAQHLIGPVAPAQQFTVPSSLAAMPDALRPRSGATFLLRRIQTLRGGRYLAVLRLRLESERPGHLMDDWLGNGPHRPGALWRFGVAGLMMGALCYALARYLTDPAIKLRRATRQFAAGDFAARVGPQMGARRDELADLGHDFDQMAERIETLMVSQRQLLGDISHELRSPLTRLSLALELASQTADAPTRGFLGRIENEIGEMNRLIGQLLTIAKLENGASSDQQNSREAAYIDLAHLLQHVAANADFEAQSRGGQVRITHLEACQIVGNGELLYSALENVVRNAILHGPDRARVEISLHIENGAGGENPENLVSHERENEPESESRNDSWNRRGRKNQREQRGRENGNGHKNADEVTRIALIRVRDYGPGVPDEALESLFHPFFRVDAARNRNSGGTGLGLSIAQRAARFHGGDMSAQNAPGGGLEVEISLPLGAASSEAELVAEAL